MFETLKKLHMLTQLGIAGISLAENPITRTSTYTRTNNTTQTIIFNVKITKKK